MTSLKYIVVEFEKATGSGKTTLEVLSETWRDTEGNRCFLYPSQYASHRILSAARKGEPPTDTWTSYPVRKEWLTTESWEKANRRCNKLTETLNPSESEDETITRKRARKVPQRYLESECSSEDENMLGVLDTPPTAGDVRLPVPPAATNLQGKTLFPGKVRMPGETSTSRGRMSETDDSGTPRSRKNTSASGSRSCVVSCPPMASTRWTECPDYLRQSAVANQRMFTLLEKISERLDRHEALLTTIIERQQAAVRPVNEEEDWEGIVLPALPCSTYESLQELNQLVESSNAIKRKLTRILGLIGGSCTRSVVGNILTELIAHPLSKDMNLTGSKGKSSLSSLKALFAVITRSIRSNKDAKLTTDKDIAALVGKWFTNARDRNGERQARRKAVLERGNGEEEEEQE